MDYVKSFLQRKADFHENVKDTILVTLRTQTQQDWNYEDGYFICHLPNNGVIFLIKGDFEPYIFNTIVALTENGECYEMDAETVEIACQIVSEYIDDLNEKEE